MTTSQSTNIYQRIFKLPPDITEPDAYELLGVPRFEPDLKKIKHALMDRNSLLQRIQNAENYEDVKRLERELGEAMVCLTNPETKAEYDRSLAPSVPPLSNETPLPAEQATQSLARFDEPTEEVPVRPDDPVEDLPEKLSSPIPNTGIRLLPPRQALGSKTTQRTKSIGKNHNVGNQSEGHLFLPGEAPWKSPTGWLPSYWPLILGSGICLALILGLLIAFWPSSSPKKNDTAQPALKQESLPKSAPLILVNSQEKPDIPGVKQKNSPEYAAALLLWKVFHGQTADLQSLIAKNAWDNTDGLLLKLRSGPDKETLAKARKLMGGVAFDSKKEPFGSSETVVCFKNRQEKTLNLHVQVKDEKYYVIVGLETNIE